MSSSATLWRAGTPGAMESLPRLMLAHGTSGIDGSALLPTLTVCGNYNRKGTSKTSGDGLATALRRFPTFVARDYRSPGRSRLERTGSKAGEHLPNVVGGPLNPEWCEWFMGWPIGHTESKHWATAKSRSKRPTPGSRSAGRGKARSEA